jgi:hypothetical protein
MIHESELMKYAGWMLVGARVEVDTDITKPYRNEVILTLQSTYREQVDIVIQSTTQDIEGVINERFR